MRVNFYLNNQRITEPLNWKELSIELNFDKDNPQAAVALNDWELGLGGYDKAQDGAAISNNHIDNGLTSGVGVFEGIPFRIELEQGAEVQELFNGFLDLSTGNISCDRVSATAFESGGIDWLNETANSVSFEYLYEVEKTITDDDFISIPYVINSIPKAGEAFLLTITAFVTAQTIKDQLQDLQGMVIETSNPISAISGVLKIAGKVIYIATVIISVVKLIFDAIKLIIQFIKYHKAMYVKDLLTIGCQHFGLTFKSSIFENSNFKNLAVLPEVRQLPDGGDGLLGYFKPSIEQKGYYNGTFGDLLRVIKQVFNAKIILENDVLTLERRDYNVSSPIYSLPNIERNGYTFNSDEFLSNVLIEFQTDLNDKNTIQEFSGTNAQMITTPKVIINRNMVLTKGFNQVSIPFSLAKRKEELTVPEKIVKAIGTILDPIIGVLVKFVNGLISVVNGIIKLVKKLINAINKLPKINIKFNPDPIKKIEYTPIRELIENRKGMLMLENDFVNIPKLFIVDEKDNAKNTKIALSNKSTVNSLYLLENYYNIDSFDPVIYEKTNQFKVYEVENVPFCYDDFLKVKQNNKILDGEKEGLIDSLNWNIWNQTANIKFRVNEIYTRNLQTKILS